MSANAAFSTIYSGLFESAVNLSEYAEKEQWARFDVSLAVDVFDGYRMYLFDCGSYSRLLVGYNRSGGNHELYIEQTLNRGEFDVVVRQLQHEIEQHLSQGSKMR